VDWIIQYVYFANGTILVASHYSMLLNVALRVLKYVILFYLNASCLFGVAAGVCACQQQQQHERTLIDLNSRTQVSSNAWSSPRKPKSRAGKLCRVIMKVVKGVAQLVRLKQRLFSWRGEPSCFQE
jgi:hypothetical protein